MTQPQLRHVGLNLDRYDEYEPGEPETAIFGFWVYLMSDAILFALLFAVYGTYIAATAGGPGPSDVFDIKSSFIETMLLLASSCTFGAASVALKAGRSRTAIAVLLGITLALGAYFLRMEIHDFMKAVSEGAAPERSGFLTAYFTLVATHGIHVTFGCFWIVVMLLQIGWIGLDDRVKVNLLRLGLFWHFLDVVWVFIFSVVFLYGLSR